MSTTTKVRTMEELNDVTISTMTDRELREYVKYLREELANTNILLEQTKRNAESSFEKVRTLQAEADRISKEANAKLSFAQQAISTCYTSIMFANKA